MSSVADVIPEQYRTFFIGDTTGLPDLSSLGDLKDLETHKGVFEQIQKMPSLYQRASALRQWRQKVLDAGSLSVLKMQNVEGEFNWKDNQALPLPTMDNPLSLPDSLLAGDADAYYDLVQNYLDDLFLLQTNSYGDAKKSAIRLLKDLIDSSKLDSRIFTTWLNDHQTNPAEAAKRVETHKRTLLDNHAFLDFDQEFVGMDFLKDVVWGIKDAFAIASGTGFKKPTMHMAFAAGSGSGKSTAPKFIGMALKRMGLLSKGHLVNASLSKVASTTHGGDEANLEIIFEKAKGGVLLFDEIDTAATYMHRGQDRSSVSQVINQKMEEMRRDVCVIVATYPQLMDTFLDSDDGLRSRFGDRVINFPDRPTQDYVVMLERNMSSFGFSVEGDSVRSQVWDYFSKLRKDGPKHFANGRTVRNFSETIQAVMAEKIRESGGSLTGRFSTRSVHDSDAYVVTESVISNAIRRINDRREPKKIDVYSEPNPFKEAVKTQQEGGEQAQKSSVISLSDRRPR